LSTKDIFAFAFICSDGIVFKTKESEILFHFDNHTELYQNDFGFLVKAKHKSIHQNDFKSKSLNCKGFEVEITNQKRILKSGFQIL